MPAIAKKPLAPDPFCLERDAEVVRRVLETGSVTAENLEVFDCVAKHITDFSRRLRGVFQMSAAPASPEVRLGNAKQLIGEGLYNLSLFEPILLEFISSNKPANVADSARTLRKIFREFRELIEEKDDQRRQILSRL